MKIDPESDSARSEAGATTSMTIGGQGHVIRLIRGQLKQLVPAATRLFETRARQARGPGFVAEVVFDGPDPRVVSASLEELRYEAHLMYYDQATDEFDCVSCDPPQGHLLTLHDADELRLLPPTSRFYRQRIIRTAPSKLLEGFGYHQDAQRFLWAYLEAEPEAALIVRGPRPTPPVYSGNVMPARETFW